MPAEDRSRREMARTGKRTWAVLAAGNKAEAVEAEGRLSCGWTAAGRAQGTRPGWRTKASLRPKDARPGRPRRSMRLVRVEVVREGKPEDARRRAQRQRRTRAGVAESRIGTSKSREEAAAAEADCS